MEYNILSCGAVADGRTNCATAIQNAVDTASAAGGGRRACHHPGRAVSEWVGIAER